MGQLGSELLTLTILAASPGFAEEIEAAVQASIAHTVDAANFMS